MKISTFFKSLLVVAFLFSGLNASFAQGKAKIILAGGTDITDIGPGCDVSINLIKDAFDYIALMTDIEMDYTYCTGSNFNKNYILKEVNSVNQDEYDVIVFFNSSHGFNYQNTPSRHTFFVAHPTESGSMSESEFASYGVSLEKEVFNPLKKKGAPVVLVFSESCNKEVKLEAPPMYKTMNPNISSRLKDLFLGEPAYVISSSSQYGQYSYTDNDKGGIYANSLLHAMNDVTTKCEFANWDKVMSFTQDYVAEYSENLAEGQTAIYDINDATPILLDSEKKKEKDNGGYKRSGIQLKKN